MLADRLNRIKPSPTLAVIQKARSLKASGRDIINMGGGEPDFDTPAHIKQAAIDAMNRGDTKYTEVDGTPQLKKAIAAKFLRENGLTYAPEQISVGTGGKQVLYNVFMAALNAGDEVIIPAPYWVSYPDIVLLAEGVPVIVPCSEEQEFKITPAQLEAAISEKTRWLILNSPSNPTGAAYSAEELKALAEVLLRYPAVKVLSDDIYEHLLYDGQVFATIAAVEPKLYDRVVTLNGVSKSYAMTGWRIGYAGGPAALIKGMSKVQSQSTSNPCSIAQAAAVGALEGDQQFLGQAAAVYVERRDKAVAFLNNVSGISVLSPRGAFYLYVSCLGLIGKKTPDGKILHSDSDVVGYLLEEEGIACVQGEAFGLSPYFRLSFAVATDILMDACARIERAVKKLV
ncbi:MAG: pyridoxal phosphate-dependent aminotransferase [Alphaproteobacteria bacterium]